MALLGYHASHEQFAPSQLLDLTTAAEKAGFTAANSSDHFHPWSETQGQSGYAWSWLGAAMQRTRFPFGVVCAPGQRYHPAIIAQAAATLADMFPNRFVLALGSGQALNELINGEVWPPKHLRKIRLKECVDIIRALWQGDTLSQGGLVKIRDAKLYSRPKILPPIFGAAISQETAQWVGGWADGLITIARPRKELEQVINAFRAGGGQGKPIHLKVQLAYAPTEQLAHEQAWAQWRCNVLGPEALSELATPAQFEAAARYVRPDDLKTQVRISRDPKQFIDWIQSDIDLGFERIILHNVTTFQTEFIHFFGENVLPRFT